MAKTIKLTDEGLKKLQDELENLKTDLENYYEKFGAVFIKKLKSNESLYKIEI